MSQRWLRTTENIESWRLLDRPEESLWRGDVISLPHHPGLGPESPGVDLMLYELWGYEDKLGLLILNGYKAGMPTFYLPPESQGEGKLTLESAWVIRHWDQWFCYWYQQDDAGAFLPLPIEQTIVTRQPQHMPDLNL